MILRSVLTEMEKPFCEEDCPGPLPLPRRAHTDRAEIIRQRRREYGRFRWRKHPISLLTGSGTSPAVRSAEDANTEQGARRVWRGPRCIFFRGCHVATGLSSPAFFTRPSAPSGADREGNSHRTSTALSVKSQAQKIVASRASVGTGRRFLAINTWSVRRPTPTILAEISWPPTKRPHAGLHFQAVSSHANPPLDTNESLSLSAAMRFQPGWLGLADELTMC